MNLKSSFLDHFEPLSMNRVAPAYTLVFHNKINPTRNFGSSILLTLSIFIRHEHCQHVHCWRSTDVVLSSRSGNTGISTLSSLSERLASESDSYSCNYGRRTHRLPRKTDTEQSSTKVTLGVRSTFFLHYFARNFLYHWNLFLRFVSA